MPTVLVAHPMVYGVSPVAVPNYDDDDSAHYGAPAGTFRDDAALVQIDPRRVCFELVLRCDDSYARLGALSGWDVSLEGDPGFASPAPEFDRSVQPEAQTALGTRHDSESYGQSETRYRRGHSYRATLYRDAVEHYPIHVWTSAQVVCFEHEGAVGTQTRELTLQLEDPDNPMHKLAWRWQFAAGAHRER